MRPSLLKKYEAQIIGGAGKGVYTGLGWHIPSSSGTAAIRHKGVAGGYRSFACFLRGSNSVMIVLYIENIGFYLLDFTFWWCSLL